jgi:hypothetical protein
LKSSAKRPVSRVKELLVRARKPTRGPSNDLVSGRYVAKRQRFSTTAQFTSTAEASSMNLSTDYFFDQLKTSDRSWWPGLFDLWKGFVLPLNSNVTASIIPASSDSLARTVATACGTQLVKESLVVVPQGTYGAESHFFVLDRDG